MKRFCECRQAMVHSIGSCIGCDDKPEPFDELETGGGTQIVLALLEALEMVRDADNDCRLDGLPTIPLAARAKIDEAIARARQE